MRGSWAKLGYWWCQTMHPEVTWPVHGKYQCETCGRTYSVRWDVAEVQPSQKDARAAEGDRRLARVEV